MTAEATSGFLVRLTTEERDALRRQAEREHRSMQEVARLAIVERTAAEARSQTVDEYIAYSKLRFADVMDELSK